MGASNLDWGMTEMTRTVVLTLLALLLPGLVVSITSCSRTPSAKAPTKEEFQYSSGDKPLRTEAEVVAALHAAESAFLAEKWGVAVVNANKVMEGIASAEQYYAAIKILGLASCNRKDLRPIAHAWSRLGPADKDSLSRECALNGLTISKTGSVTPSAPR